MTTSATESANGGAATQYINKLVSTIRLKHGQLELWPTADGRFCVRVGEERRDCFQGDLVTVLEQAAAHVQLPVIPRRPAPCSRSGFSTQKYSGGWLLLYHGQTTGIGCKRKKDCEDAADKAVIRAEQARQKWDEMYGEWLYKTEGVDFAWER